MGVEDSAVNRTTAVSVATIILSVGGGITYEVHRRFASMASTMDALAHKVDQATHVADSAAVDAHEARAQAAEAAENAKAAAGAGSKPSICNSRLQQAKPKRKPLRSRRGSRPLRPTNRWRRCAGNVTKN